MNRYPLWVQLVIYFAILLIEIFSIQVMIIIDVQMDTSNYQKKIPSNGD
jgi:hypothetical protein